MSCVVCSGVSHVESLFLFLAKATMSDSDHSNEYCEPASGSEQEDFEPDGDDDIEMNEPATLDTMTQLVADQRDADVIEEEEFSDIFDPEEDDDPEQHATFTEVEKEKLCATWQRSGTN